MLRYFLLFLFPLHACTRKFNFIQAITFNFIILSHHWTTVRCFFPCIYIPSKQPLACAILLFIFGTSFPNFSQQHYSTSIWIITFHFYLILISFFFIYLKCVALWTLKSLNQSFKLQLFKMRRFVNIKVTSPII